MSQDFEQLIAELKAKILRHKRAKLDDEEEYALGRLSLSEMRLRGEQHDKAIEVATAEIEEMKSSALEFEALLTSKPNREIGRYVFISYARRDGRDLALRLQRDLIATGYAVWLDTAEIEGGTSWSSEIEKAIEDCDITVALLSHGSFVSEICRAEQLRALRKGKPVIPVLVQPNAERPLHLEHLNYRDFSDPTQYDTVFRLLRDDLETDENIPLPVNRQQTIVSAPPLPPHFIARSSELDFLRRTVIGDETDDQIALTALRGMGGIGKSVLATALCYDEVIQAAFPDGIIWVTIGREPGNLAEQMKYIGTKLGDSPGYYTSEDAGSDRLRELLAHKAVLLVLDDVWDAKHISFFRINAPRCRTVFTTRDGGIALTVGASEVRLGTLSKKQSLSLLAEWAGREDDTLPKIAERLGYLPLALKLAGARLREGMSGQEWLRTFRHVSQMKLGRRSRDPHENLEVCFDLSVQQLMSEDQLLYHAIGVFPEDVAVPQRVVVRLWRQLDPQLTEYDANELAVDLARLALIDRNAKDETITLHDLLHDYTRSKLSDNLEATHRSLLSAYNPENLEWWKIEHDGYLYFQLGYHLIGAGYLQDFIDLIIGQPDWMEAKFVACQGDVAFVADLDFAMRQYSDPLTRTEAQIVTQLYVARQIVNMRASVYTDDDLQTLVYLGRTSEALNHARIKVNQLEKFNGLIAIYRATLDRNSENSDIRDDMLAALRNIPDDDQRREHTINISNLLREQGDPLHLEIFREALFDFTSDRVQQIMQMYHIAVDLEEANHPTSKICFKSIVYLIIDRKIDGMMSLQKIEKPKSRWGKRTDNRHPLARIVMSLLSDERIEAAVKLAANYPSEQLLSEIALWLLEQGSFQQSVEVADTIRAEAVNPRRKSLQEIADVNSNPFNPRRNALRDTTFEKIIKKLIDLEELDVATEALRVGGLEKQGHLTLSIALKLTSNGKFEQAMELIREIQSISYTPHDELFSFGTFDTEENNDNFLDGIVSILISRQRLDLAVELVDIVVAREAENPGDSQFNTWKLYDVILDNLLSSGQIDPAMDIARTIKVRKFELMQKLPVNNLLAEARRYYDNEQYDFANTLYSWVIERGNENEEALWCLSLLSDSGEQISDYLEQLYAINEDMILQRAVYLHRQGKYEEGIALVRRLLQQNPEHLMAHLWLNVLNTSSDEEQNYLRQVLQIEVGSTNLPAIGRPLRMVTSVFPIDVVQEHVTYSRKLGTGLGEADYSLLADLGVAAYSANQIDEARRWLTRALNLQPGNTLNWHWLRAVIDDVSDQQTCLQNILTIDPDDGAARRYLEILTNPNAEIGKQDNSRSRLKPLPFTRRASTSVWPIWAYGQKALSAEIPPEPGHHDKQVEYKTSSYRDQDDFFSTKQNTDKFDPFKRARG